MMIGKKTVVYTSGKFDMRHINHLRLIENVRGLGDIYAHHTLSGLCRIAFQECFSKMFQRLMAGKTN